jgi:hypothetical protein
MLPNIVRNIPIASEGRLGVRQQSCRFGYKLLIKKVVKAAALLPHSKGFATAFDKLRWLYMLKDSNFSGFCNLLGISVFW